jgi:hypothetical protein
MDTAQIKDKMTKSLALSYDILKLGNVVSAELDEQNEQLDRISDKTNTINENVNNATKTLNNIASYYTSLLGLCNYDIVKTSVTNSNKTKSTHHNNRSEDEDELFDSIVTGKIIKTDEETRINELHDLVLQMKFINQNINESLTTHNEKVNDIVCRADTTNRNIRNANNQINKLL